jgi:hypothetical protein
LNRHAHIGGAELGKDGAVDEFDHGVDGGLRMNEDIDLVWANVEEPTGFDDFEAFIHHGGGIDGNAVAHAPVGVGQGLVDGNVFHFRKRRFPERATRGGEDQAADVGVESVRG